MQGSTTIVTVPTKKKYKKVSLVAPTKHSYLILAAQVDDSALPIFLTESNTKKKLLASCKQACSTLSNNSEVVNASVFKAVLIPPGRGAYAESRNDLTPAKYDVVVLIEANDAAQISSLRSSDVFQQMWPEMQKSKYSLQVTATNARRIGPVDHNKQGIFLFNYFVAEDTLKNLGIWEYTAGWFEEMTGLDNSTLLLPDDTNDIPYSVINHCRWNSIWDILPSLLFKRSFRSYVLNNFEANNVAAIPILYKLA